MQIRIGETSKRIDGYKPVDSRLDRAYKEFYESYFGTPTFSQLMDVSLPPLLTEIEQYLDRDPAKSVIHKSVINNLTPVWSSLLENELYREAQYFWAKIHRSIHSWELTRGSRIHKGALLYYWGGTALMQGELDKGFFLMHGAYEQDVLTSASDMPNTPAFKFVTMDFESSDQLFSQYAQLLAHMLSKFFVQYRIARLSHFTIEDFRKGFLEGVEDPSITFAFTHALARLYQLEGFTPLVKQSTFASHYQLGLLFELLLVAEAGIKLKDPVASHKYFSEFVGFLAKQAGLQLTQSDLQQHVKSSANADFNSTFTDLLFKAYRLPSGYRLTRLECDIALAYTIRNLAAHDIKSSPLIWGQFKGISQSIINVLLLAAETLYI
jgi:hypothetical protein